MYSIAFFQPIYQNTVKIPCVFVFFKIIPGEQRLQSSKVESKETPNHQSQKSFWVIQSCLFWLSMQLLPELRSVQHTNCDSTARKLKLTIPRITSLEESESQSANTQLQEPSKGRQWAKTLEIRWSEMSETCKTRAKSKLLRRHLMHPNWNCTPWPTGDALKCNMLHFRMIGWRNMSGQSKPKHKILGVLFGSNSDISFKDVYVLHRSGRSFPWSLQPLPAKPWALEELVHRAHRPTAWAEHLSIYNRWNNIFETANRYVTIILYKSYTYKEFTCIATDTQRCVHAHYIYFV